MGPPSTANLLAQIACANIYKSTCTVTILTIWGLLLTTQAACTVKVRISKVWIVKKNPQRVNLVAFQAVCLNCLCKTTASGWRPNVQRTRYT